MSKLSYTCGCGYNQSAHPVAVNDDGSCCCNDCTGLAYPRDGTFSHADFCRVQKEKKAAEEKEKENTKPPAAEVGVTHDASGYPLPGKCVCGYELAKYDHPPETGKCMCYICMPGKVKSHYGHCLQQLKNRLEMFETDREMANELIDRLKAEKLVLMNAAKDKDDRITELEEETKDQKRRIREMIGPHNSAVEKLDEKDRTIHKHLQVIDTLNATVSRLEDRLGERSKIIENQSKYVFAKDDRITELEQEVESLRSLNRALAHDVQDKNRKIAELKAEVAELKKPQRPLIRESSGRIDPELIQDPVAAIKELYKCNDKLRGEMAEARITLANKDKRINEQAHGLQEKQTEIQTLRAQMEGLEHDKATLQDKVADLTNDLDKRTSKWHNLKTRVAELESEIACRDHDAPLVDWLHMEETKKLQAELNKAKAQIKELESIIAAYAGDDSRKTGVINELTEKMVHFKKYRKFVIRTVRQRIYSCIEFSTNYGELVPSSKFQIEQFLSVYPELRQRIISDLAEACQRLSLGADLPGGTPRRANLIAYGQRLLKDGGEHSPASGSAPESG